MLVRGEGRNAEAQWLDAYAWLLEHPSIVTQCEITEPDAADYGPNDGTYDDSGVWMDTEAVKLYGPIRVGLQFDRRES